MRTHLQVWWVATDPEGNLHPCGSRRRFNYTTKQGCARAIGTSRLPVGTTPKPYKLVPHDQTQ